MGNSSTASRVVSAIIQGKKHIGTHNGHFHCDEALACAMLKMLPEFKDHIILRTRTQELLGACDVVCDVGGVYNPETRRYDHHQKGFTDTLSELGFVTKLSSAGLVYRHYGKAVIRELSKDVQLTDAVVDIIYRKIYVGFMEGVDGIDNGVEVSDGPQRYKVTTDLSARVGHLNPSWNQDQGDALANAQFERAMELTGGELHAAVRRLVDSWWPARSIVQQAYSKRTEVDASGEIMLLTQQCPWKGHLYDLEAECNQFGTVKYVIYGDNNGNARVQAVSESEGSFASRLPLPAAWRGLRDQALSDASEIPGGVFVHMSGFIGGNATMEGSIAMARKALAMRDAEAEAARRK